MTGLATGLSFLMAILYLCPVPCLRESIYFTNVDRHQRGGKCYAHGDHQARSKYGSFIADSDLTYKLAALLSLHYLAVKYLFCTNKLYALETIQICLYYYELVHCIPVYLNNKVVL